MLGLASGPALLVHESASEGHSLPPAELALRLRSLAQDAYRVSKDGHASSAELVELARRIDELRAHARGSRMFEIERWLERTSAVVCERQTA